MYINCKIVTATYRHIDCFQFDETHLPARDRQTDRIALQRETDAPYYAATYYGKVQQKYVYLLYRVYFIFISKS